MCKNSLEMLKTIKQARRLLRVNYKGSLDCNTVIIKHSGGGYAFHFDFSKTEKIGQVLKTKFDADRTVCYIIPPVKEWCTNDKKTKIRLRH